jgi:PAS domain S-box-containing protein
MFLFSLMFFLIFDELNFKAISFAKNQRMWLNHLGKLTQYQELHRLMERGSEFEINEKVNEINEKVNEIKKLLKEEVKKVSYGEYQFQKLKYIAANSDIVIEISLLDQLSKEIPKKSEWHSAKDGFFSERTSVVTNSVDVWSEDGREVIGKLVSTALTDAPVAFNFPFEDVNLRLALWTGSGILLLIFHIVLIYVLTKILIHRLLKPLVQLANAIKKVSQGELALHVQIERDDEIGMLAKGVNDMLKSLRQKQNVERRLTDLIKTSTDWIWEIDTNSVYTYTNPAVETVLGYTPEEILTMTPLSIIHPEEREKLRQTLSRLKEEQNVVRSVRHRVIKKNHEVCYLDISAVAAFDAGGALIGLRGIGRDVTRQRLAEEEQKRLNAEILQVNKDLESFVCSVSHDLQRPLLGIKSNIKLIARDKSVHLSAEAVDYLSRMEQCSKTMGEIIEGIVEVFRVGRVDMEPRWVDVEKLVNRIWLDMQYRGEAKNVALKVVLPLPKAWCNEKRLKQVFTNLLDNAVKFMYNSPSPFIKISGYQEDNYVHFYVSDNGPGIAVEQQKRIFNIFERLHGDNIPGTGMGLYFIKKIIETYAGRIWVESKAGEGAAFHFTLPVFETATAISVQYENVMVSQK